LRLAGAGEAAQPQAVDDDEYRAERQAPPTMSGLSSPNTASGMAATLEAGDPEDVALDDGQRVPRQPDRIDQEMAGVGPGRP
jgi:hypothetical protein